MHSELSSLVPAWQNTWKRSDVSERIALQTHHGNVTYADMSQRIATFAGGLAESGVQRGDLIALDMERSVDAVIALFGCIVAGACPCPLEPDLTAAQTQERLDSVGIGWLLCSAAHKEKVDGNHSFSQKVLIADEMAHGSRQYWHQELTGQDKALLLFTSGSTGRPKGVLLTHENILTNAVGVIRHSDLSDRDRLLHVMPLHHTNGLNNQLFAPFLCGATVVFAGRFKAGDMPDLMHQYQPTIITGVPTMYARMLSQAFSSQGRAALRMARCGSAPITVDLHRQIEAKLGCPLIVSYGLSEATCTSTMNPPRRRKIGTVGTVLQGQQLALLGPTGEPVGEGHEGEICIAGASVMAGYLGADPGSTDRVVQNGWLRTGDLGRFDSEGYLAITGRIKEVIIRGGENLSPAVIENVITSHEGVAACCVVGMPHADLGEVPVAVVVAASTAHPTKQDILDVVATRLARVYQPADVRFVDALPENAVGKIDRKAVTALLQTTPA